MPFLGARGWTVSGGWEAGLDKRATRHAGYLGGRGWAVSRVPIKAVLGGSIMAALPVDRPHQGGTGAQAGP
jgi:hypothetical protein